MCRPNGNGAAIGVAELICDLLIGAAVDRHLNGPGTPPRGQGGVAVLNAWKVMTAVPRDSAAIFISGR